MELDESKSATEHLIASTSTLSQLQDSGLPPFDDKLKSIFLLMTLPDLWETLVVSLSNNPNLTFDGIKGSILNEEIRRKASGEGSGSANVAQARTEKKSDNVQRNKCKSKGTAAEVTCYQCGSKGHKKPDCKYYKAELARRKNTGDKKKKDNDNIAHNNIKDKEKNKPI